MEIVNLIQGSPEWHAHRKQFLNASDAPAMMGCSSYTSRSELIKRLATGIVPEVDSATQRRFDDGHKFEALARPLAEAIIGEELAPLVGVVGKFSASFDGLTLMEDAAFEHKSLNDRLRGVMVDGSTGTDLPPEYQIQMEHQSMVSSCQRILFMASKWRLDPETGEYTCEESRHCWYTPNPELRAKIVAGWAQLEQDVAAYVPEAEPAQPATEAKLRDALPALRLDAKGEITASNLDDFKAIALSRINTINTVLETDQQFADADDDSKWLRDVADAMKQAGKRVRANMQSVDEALSVLEQLDKIATAKAIDLEKRVKGEKDVRKQAIVLEAQQGLDSHIAALNQRLGNNWLPRLAGGFAEVIKGLKSLDSMRDKLAVALTNAKVDANALSDRLEANRKHLVQADQDWITLFADFATVGAKAAEDFQALAALRIGQHKEAEAIRLEAERERIRAQEAAKAKHEAELAMREELQKREQEAQASIAQAVENTEISAPVAADLSGLAKRAAAESVAAIDAKHAIGAAQARAAVHVDDGARISLGQIKTLIAPLSIDAAGLAELGFPHVATEKASKLYRECDLPAIRDAMVKHLQSIQIAELVTA